MTTLGELAEKALNQVGDSGAGTWSQELIEEWCIDAIRDYSQHLPRTRIYGIVTTEGEQKYDLPSDFRAMLSVQYPVAAEPPVYLERLSFEDARFWRMPGYYDVIHHDDAEDPDELWISQTPGDAEGIRTIFKADHAFDLGTDDEITVPGRHEHILVDFVLWRAWLELLGKEQQKPTSNSSLLMSQYASNADRAKRQYVESLARAIRSEEGQSERVTWKLDKWDRIY